MAIPSGTTHGSLAYRKHQAGIWNGVVPEKYLRILPYVTGNTILEIGAAEGVLALLMAEQHPRVLALEQNKERHYTAVALQLRWLNLGRRVNGCTMLVGDVRDNLHLFEGVDTVVAIRTIYHFGDSIEAIFDAMYQAGVSSVVLGGNQNRARRAANGTGDRFDNFASVQGMSRILQTSGFKPDAIVREGDPIVTGHR